MSGGPGRKLMQEIERLVKMANQIADNLVFHDDAVERIADHLVRFWAPSMRQKLTEYATVGGDGLKSEVRAALRHLAADR
jgi:ABC-type transporter Mla subunit MlaD